MERPFGASPEELYPKSDIKNPKLEVLKTLADTKERIESNLGSPHVSAENKMALRGTLVEIENQLKELREK